jgi:hypothetical protein
MKTGQLGQYDHLVELLRKSKLGKGGAGTSDRCHLRTLARQARLAKRRAKGDFVTLARPTLFSSSCCASSAGMSGSSENSMDGGGVPL